MKQNKTPIQFERTRRYDRGVIRTSGDPGQVVPVAYMPLLRGDSASGDVAVMVDLAPMPKPTLNAVILNAQAWFVPKHALPQFSSHAEFVSSYNGESIKALGQADRNPPALFAHRFAVDAGSNAIAKTLGLHSVGIATDPTTMHSDLTDSYNLIQNFRRQARSKALPLRSYSTEDVNASISLAEAFWPQDSLTGVVPDYERALIVGNLDFDLAAGQVPISGIGTRSPITHETGQPVKDGDGDGATWDGFGSQTVADSDAGIFVKGNADRSLDVFGELAGQSMTTTLAGIDKARELQSFARLRSTYAGLGVDDYAQDRAVIADLMQGLGAATENLRHPFILDSRQVQFGMSERFSTDSVDLEASLTEGMAQVELSLNVPVQDSGGVIIITIEVVPERVRERQEDPWLMVESADEFPDATRDTLIDEPVEEVLNRHVDSKHTSPNAIYGFRPLNHKWNRDFTRLGGAFRQPNPEVTTVSEQRANLWLVNTVDPEFTQDHYLCPQPFPKDVFADTLAPAFEVTARHAVMISGLTQFGDEIVENTDDYAAISGE